MIKVVFIDIDNTLLDFNRSAQSSMRSAAFDCDIAFSDDIYKIYKDVNSVLWQALERGEITMEKIFQVRWNIIFEEAGISYDGEAFEQLYRQYLSETGIPIDGAEELLDYLHEKYTVCAASNGVWKQQVNRLKNAGLYNYIRAVYTSDVIGFQKPTKNFYVECLKKVSCLLPEEKLPIWNNEAVMIGDSLTADINGIRAYGIEPIWFNFENTDARPEYEDCKIVTSLNEIEDLL